MVLVHKSRSEKPLEQRYLKEIYTFMVLSKELNFDEMVFPLQAVNIKKHPNSLLRSIRAPKARELPH